MELREIERVPEFECDIDELSLSNMETEAHRNLARTLSKMRQRGAWTAETARVAHNLSVQNAVLIRRVLYSLVALIASAVVAKVVDSVWDREPQPRYETPRKNNGG